MTALQNRYPRLFNGMLSLLTTITLVASVMVIARESSFLSVSIESKEKDSIHNSEALIKLHLTGLVGVYLIKAFGIKDKK